ncbi:MAG: hypothetical protein J5496_09720 [Lachnospiraceae bacterium]|nr:hypothetical protein [Lachnospiraceae bacterium]
MAETYCGKNCAECTEKELLNCPGCQAGPGRKYGGDCELAACCREKGHESCGTCAFRENCRKLLGREQQPKIRQRRIEAQQKREAEEAARRQFLGKWLWILFWLIVPATVAGLFGNEYVSRASAPLYVFGQVLSAACSLAYALILLKLSAEEEHYRTAGICDLITVAAGLLILILFRGEKAPAWSLAITLPALFVRWAGEYNEYQGHSEILSGTDTVLQEKWLKLWKWYRGCMMSLLAGSLLVLAAPVLGALLVTAASIGIIVVDTVKLVYLYRTAKIFREEPEEKNGREN